MIVLRTSAVSHTLQPTIFPDGTSQVWKLPEAIFRSSHVDVTWNFENEREILDLLSLRKLLPNPAYTMNLHIPYLPYGRQDKDISNTSTFNLRVFADLINSLSCYKVTTVDAHNPVETRVLIRNFQNLDPIEFQLEAIKHSEPNYLVFPDSGAQLRYGSSLKSTGIPIVVCAKARDPLSGEIIGHQIVDGNCIPVELSNNKFLIIDDLCDGGATFISVTRLLRGNLSNKVDLCVTHGIFSRGRDHLYNNRITNIFTTNSLISNKEGYKV